MTTLNISSREFSSFAADLLQQGNTLRVRVTGQSMAPVILPGDIVTIVPALGESLRKGDVALYQRPGGEPVVHRVVRRTASGRSPLLHFIGDAQVDPSEPVECSRILGRAVRVDRDDVSRPLDHRARNLSALWQAHLRWQSHRLLHIASRCRTLLARP